MTGIDATPPRNGPTAPTAAPQGLAGPARASGTPEAATTLRGFFVAGHTYRHFREDGTPSAEGLFLVVHAGTAPEPYEHHSETLGVALGWRQGIGPNGEWEALGAYETPDFAGWVEVRPVDDSGSVPDGCRWCGDSPSHHGHQYTPGIGLHQWAQPSDKQRLARMNFRRSARKDTNQ